jgi:hypothetical protein
MCCANGARKKEFADPKEPMLKTYTRVFLSSLDLKEKSLSTQAAVDIGVLKTATITSAMPPPGRKTVTDTEDPKQPRTSL